MKKRQCIAFDIDDTLYLERDFVRSGFTEVGRWVEQQFGYSGFGALAWGLFEEGRKGDIFDVAMQRAGIPYEEQTIKKIVTIYRTHSPDIALLPDAAMCLQALHGWVSLALISDGPHESQQNKIKALCLLRAVDIVVLTEAGGRGFAKPHPRAFEEVQNRTGCRGRQCVYVADKPAKDFLAPRQLGWRTIRVRRREGLYSAVEAPEYISAETEVPDLSSVATIVQREP